MRSSIAVSFPILVLGLIFGLGFLIVVVRGLGRSQRSRGDQPMSVLGSFLAVICFLFMIPLVFATLFFAASVPTPAPIEIRTPKTERLIVETNVTDPISQPVPAPVPPQPQLPPAPRAKKKVTQNVKHESLPPPLVQVEGGYYKSQDDAFKDAVEKARGMVSAKLEKYGLSCYPSAKDIERMIYDKQYVPYPNPQEHPDMEDMQRMDLSVSLGEREIASFKQQERSLRAHDRVALLAKISAGLIALLLTVGGYVRLDEMSKGYYSGWLRVGAVTAAALFAGLGFLVF